MCAAEKLTRNHTDGGGETQGNVAAACKLFVRSNSEKLSPAREGLKIILLAPWRKTGAIKRARITNTLYGKQDYTLNVVTKRR